MFFNRFTYLVCPLVNTRFKREHIAQNLKHQNMPLTRSDLELGAEAWQTYVVGHSSQYYNCDSDDEIIRKNAIMVFEKFPFLTT